MVKPQDFIVWLKDIDIHDTRYVGGKAANLGEMIQAKFPVPDGFVITSYAYHQFLKENKLELKIKQLLSTIDYNNQDSLSQVSRHLRHLIIQSEIPKSILELILNHYKSLGGVFHDSLVAIRSSATGEDSKESSFAGQQETYLNIKGEAHISEKVKQGWSSLFSPRALYYRHEKKMQSDKTGIALVVQRMVESDISGIMFTVDPVLNDKTKTVIEAIYGLGEYIVGGKVTPDQYQIDKISHTILSKKIAEQFVMLEKRGRENKEVKVPFLKRKKQKLSDREIIALAKLGQKLERHYYFPQDIEWAIERGRCFIVQTRPITTISTHAKRSESISPSEHKKELILKGDPASPGIGIGRVKIVRRASEIGLVRKGDVLVAPFTNPDYVPAMKRASAIVTERGGRTSHAAIVSREFGIPAVVGAPDALKLLKDGRVVTVDGKSGIVYRGSLLASSTKNVTLQQSYQLKTHTKLYVNIADPDVAAEISGQNIDGIGLLRAEFMIAKLGVHPKKLIHENKQKMFINNLVEGLEQISKSFYPRPVIYRATDFKTNEYRNLKGGAPFEPSEPNPMLGYRGAFRYIHDPKVFYLELEAIKIVRERKKLTNLHLMLPFVRTIHELRLVKKLISNKGLIRSRSFLLYMMCEIPSNVILLDEYIKEGIDGVSIGSNDLTMLLLGVDRDNNEVALEFDERDKAVLWAYEKVIKTCRKYDIPSSICGQAPSVFPDLLEKLVDWGINSISVAPDVIDTSRRLIYEVENKLKK